MLWIAIGVWLNKSVAITKQVDDDLNTPADYTIELYGIPKKGDDNVLKEKIVKLFDEKTKVENINIVKKFDEQIKKFSLINDAAKIVRDLRTTK